MHDQFAPRSTRAPAKVGISPRAALLTSLFAFTGGAVLIGWLVFSGRIAVDGNPFAPRPPAVQKIADLPKAAPVAGPVSAAADQVRELEQEVTTLEQRLARLDQAASAAQGNAQRAEALLVAFAARRTIERGEPLGFLETQLQNHFGPGHANEVRTLIEAARKPDTDERLATDLDALGPALASGKPGESGWDRFSRELNSLFVVRREATQAILPEARLERARALLRVGRPGVAADEVAQLPGAAAAGDWIARARRRGEALRALDRIEADVLQNDVKPSLSLSQP